MAWYTSEKEGAVLVERLGCRSRKLRGHMSKDSNLEVAPPPVMFFLQGHLLNCHKQCHQLGAECKYMNLWRTFSL